MAKIELISNRIETRERGNTSSNKPGLTLLLSETIVIVWSVSLDDGCQQFMREHVHWASIVNVSNIILIKNVECYRTVRMLTWQLL